MSHYSLLDFASARFRAWRRDTLPRVVIYRAADPGWRAGWNVYNIEERIMSGHYQVVGRRIIGAYVVLGSRCIGLQWRRP